MSAATEAYPSHLPISWALRGPMVSVIARYEQRSAIGFLEISRRLCRAFVAEQGRRLSVDKVTCLHSSLHLFFILHKAAFFLFALRYLVACSVKTKFYLCQHPGSVTSLTSLEPCQVFNSLLQVVISIQPVTTRAKSMRVCLLHTLTIGQKAHHGRAFNS